MLLRTSRNEDELTKIIFESIPTNPRITIGYRSSNEVTLFQGGNHGKNMKACISQLGYRLAIVIWIPKDCQILPSLQANIVRPTWAID